MGKMRSRNKQKGQRTEQAIGLKGKLSKAEEIIFQVNTDKLGKERPMLCREEMSDCPSPGPGQARERGGAVLITFLWGLVSQ